MAARGFRARSVAIFRFFCTPKPCAEYALARSERKSGHGYRGFVFSCRTGRDPGAGIWPAAILTVNAMALGVDGTLIDPFEGRLWTWRRDVCVTCRMRLSKTPSGFSAWRVFATRFADFRIADKTPGAVSADGGRWRADPPGARTGLAGNPARPDLHAQPSRFFDILRDVGALAVVSPGNSMRCSVFRRPLVINPEIDTGRHTLMGCWTRPPGSMPGWPSVFSCWFMIWARP